MAKFETRPLSTSSSGASSTVSVPGSILSTTKARSPPCTQSPIQQHQQQQAYQPPTQHPIIYPGAQQNPDSALMCHLLASFQFQQQMIGNLQRQMALLMATTNSSLSRQPPTLYPYPIPNPYYPMQPLAATSQQPTLFDYPPMPFHQPGGAAVLLPNATQMHTFKVPSPPSTTPVSTSKFTAQRKRSSQGNGKKSKSTNSNNPSVILPPPPPILTDHVAANSDEYLLAAAVAIDPLQQFIVDEVYMQDDDSCNSGSAAGSDLPSLRSLVGGLAENGSNDADGIGALEGDAAVTAMLLRSLDVSPVSAARGSAASSRFNSGVAGILYEDLHNHQKLPHPQQQHPRQQQQHLDPYHRFAQPK